MLPSIDTLGDASGGDSTGANPKAARPEELPLRAATDTTIIPGML